MNHALSTLGTDGKFQLTLASGELDTTVARVGAMNRRHFITATGTALAALPATLRGAENISRTRIPIGFLGATYSHGPDKIKLVMTSPDWEFVGVCEASVAGRRTCGELGATLISQAELLERARVVVVESDPRDHAAYALLALRADRHVHLEKPPAMTLAEVRDIAREARERKRLLQAGFMWRFHPGFQKLFEAVRQGWLGGVFLVRGYISNNLAVARRPEWAAYPGGSMFELGSHLVDAVVRLLGRPRAVTPFVRHQGKQEDGLKDNNVAVLEYERAMAVLVNTAMQPSSLPARSFEVLGTNGTATLQPIEPPTLMLDLVAPAGPYAAGAQKVALPEYRRYEADFKELAAAVRGERPLSVSLEEEALVAETVLRASGMVEPEP